MIKERPILFSAPMVRAILDGSKTQTRRVIKFKEPYTSHDSWKAVYKHPVSGYIFTDKPASTSFLALTAMGRDGKQCPYGKPGDGPLRTFKEQLPSGDGYFYIKWTPEDAEQLVYLSDLRKYDWYTDDGRPPFNWGENENSDPECVALDIPEPWNIQWRKPGDRLWVRETFWVDKREPKSCVIYSQDSRYYKYKEDGKLGRCYDDMSFHKEYLPLEMCEKAVVDNKHWIKKPSIFMPRWASRILLEVVSVRVERVQDISSGDAEAEGLKATLSNGSPKRNFYDLWDSINNKPGKAWADNPWVWVVEFKVIK